MSDEESGRDLVDKWRNQNKVWSLEGDSGLKKLEELFKVVGYGHQFRFGDPIQHFLSDCSGACEALVEYFADEIDKNEEWKEAFKEATHDPEEDEEENDAD